MTIKKVTSRELVYIRLTRWLSAGFFVILMLLILIRGIGFASNFQEYIEVFKNVFLLGFASICLWLAILLIGVLLDGSTDSQWPYPKERSKEFKRRKRKLEEKTEARTSDKNRAQAQMKIFYGISQSGSLYSWSKPSEVTIDTLLMKVAKDNDESNSEEN